MDNKTPLLSGRINSSKTQNINKEAKVRNDKIVDIFSNSRRQSDRFNISPILLAKKDATPKEIFSAMKEHIKTYENNTRAKEIQNMRDIIEEFKDKEQELFGEACKKLITRDYDDVGTDSNMDDVLYCLTDIMFKIGQKMPKNFFELARQFKEIPHMRTYFCVTGKDLANRYTLKNMRRYFEDERTIEGDQFHFHAPIEFDEDIIQDICNDLKGMKHCSLMFSSDCKLDDTCKELLKQFKQEQEKNGGSVYLGID